jgi:hypothetical protein
MRVYTMAKRFLKTGWFASAVMLSLLMAACQTPLGSELAFAQASGGLHIIDFPAPQHLLRGFDERQAKGAWCRGDEVLFGLRLRNEGEVRHWLLQLRVLEVTAIDGDGELIDPVDWALRINGEVQEFESAVCRAEVVIMDEHGVELGRSQPLLPRDFLSSGIASACRFVRHRMSKVGSRVYETLDMRPLAEATVSAVALLQVVQEDSVLAPILWQVIEKPTVWSVVANMGIRVRIRPSFHRVTSAISPVPVVLDQTWRLPIALEVNQTPALNLDLFVTEPSSPFSLAGGLLGATASHPTNPALDFSLLLLSAKRSTSVESRLE